MSEQKSNTLTNYKKYHTKYGVTLVSYYRARNGNPLYLVNTVNEIAKNKPLVGEQHIAELFFDDDLNLIQEPILWKKNTEFAKFRAWKLMIEFSESTEVQYPYKTWKEQIPSNKNTIKEFSNEEYQEIISFYANLVTEYSYTEECEKAAREQQEEDIRREKEFEHIMFENDQRNKLEEKMPESTDPTTKQYDTKYGKTTVRGLIDYQTNEINFRVETLDEASVPNSPRKVIRNYFIVIFDKDGNPAQSPALWKENPENAPYHMWRTLKEKTVSGYSHEEVKEILEDLSQLVIDFSYSDEFMNFIRIEYQGKLKSEYDMNTALIAKLQKHQEQLSQMIQQYK